MSGGPPDREQLDRLVSELYATLKVLAQGALREGRDAQDASPTEIVSECYTRLARNQAARALDATELVAFAARAMRSVLVDRARRSEAWKRGGRMRRVSLDGEKLALAQEVDLLDLDLALEKLARIDERQSQIVELRFFGGLTHARIAGLLRCSERTVNAEWAMARAWLHRELGGSTGTRASRRGSD